MTPSPILSQICSHTESAPPTPTVHGGQPITVHDFLQDLSASGRAGRKYGRRNRLATVKLDAYHHSEDCRSRTPITPSSWSVETRNERHFFAYPRIQFKHKRLSRRVPHPRRKKQLAKSLAQRLFEADVFSSGTSYRPLSARDPAHTSSRQPLQFITSLNLTPSLESRSRICEKKWARHGRTRKSSAAADPEMRVMASQSDGSASGTLPSSNRPAIATGDGKPSSRSRNEASTQRTRTAAAGLASGKRAFRTRGGKLTAAQVRPSPFEYVPLPLMRVELAPRIRSYANDPSTAQAVRGGHACVGVKPISINVLRQWSEPRIN